MLTALAARFGRPSTILFEVAAVRRMIAFPVLAALPTLAPFIAFLAGLGGPLRIVCEIAGAAALLICHC